MGDTLQLEHGPVGERSEDGAGAWSWLEESSDLWGNTGVSHRTSRRETALHFVWISKEIHPFLKCECGLFSSTEAPTESFDSAVKDAF